MSKINVKGCRFRLGQSWQHKIEQVRLSADYKITDTETGMFLRHFFGLPFLHPNDVEDYFIKDLISIIPNDSRVKTFCNYVL